MFSHLSAYFSRGRESDIVRSDHSYCKPWSTHPDASRSRPIRTLLVRMNGKRGTDDEEVDVEHADYGDRTFPTIYDLTKARSLMDECETYSDLVNRKKLGDNWHELIVKDGWSHAQHTLFDKVVSILEGDVLARLAYARDVSEPVMRRLHNDKTAKKVRRVFGDIAWDETLCQWLHATLSDNLSSQLLGVYLDILQVLRSKVPSLVDMMTSASASVLPATSEALALLLKRPWDPAIALTVQSKQRKLTGSPFLVLIPSTPTSPAVPSTRRSRAWHNQLSTLGRVVPVTASSSVYHEGSGVSPDDCAEKMVYVTRCKVQELQGHFNTRPVVLIGWGAGALVACKVSQMEDVTAIVCLGFPMKGLGGAKDIIDEMLMELTTPIFFVVGSDASNCNVKHLDNLRDKLKVESSMTVVTGADDQLRVNWEKKKLEGVTQTTVDRCLQEEIGEFLCYTLTMATYRDIIDVDTHDAPTRTPRTRRRPRTISVDTKTHPPSSTRPSDPLQPPAKRFRDSPTILSVRASAAAATRHDARTTPTIPMSGHGGQQVLTPFPFKSSTPLAVASTASQTLVRASVASQALAGQAVRPPVVGASLRPHMTPVNVPTVSSGRGVVSHIRPALGVYSTGPTVGVTKPLDLAQPVYLQPYGKLVPQSPVPASSPVSQPATPSSATPVTLPVMAAKSVTRPAVGALHGLGISNEQAFQYHQVNPGVVPRVEQKGQKQGDTGGSGEGQVGEKKEDSQQKDMEKKETETKIATKSEKDKDVEDADQTDDDDEEKFCDFKY